MPCPMHWSPSLLSSSLIIARAGKRNIFMTEASAPAKSPPMQKTFQAQITGPVVAVTGTLIDAKCCVGDCPSYLARKRCSRAEQPARSTGLRWTVLTQPSAHRVQAFIISSRLTNQKASFIRGWPPFWPPVPLNQLAVACSSAAHPLPYVPPRPGAAAAMCPRKSNTDT